MKALAQLSLLLVACTMGLAGRAIAESDDEQLSLSGLTETFNLACQQAAPPGAVIGLSLPGRPTTYLEYGLANLDDNISIQATEPVPIGSITKLFTAVVVLQLCEEGRLRLDAPVASFFPELPNPAGITVQHLLNHSSGIYDYAELQQDVPLPMVALALAYRWDPYDVVHGAMEHERYFPPGGGFHYSNTNYFLLGLIVEQITGKSMSDELRERIAEPLGLEHTYLTGFDTRPRPSVRGYLWENDDYRDSTMLENPTLAWTAGGMTSSTVDLITFSQALFSGELLSADSRKAMLSTIQRPSHGGYGLGLMDVDAEGVQLLGHGGGTLAFRSGLWFLPGHDIHLVTLTNLANCDIWIINEAVLRWALQQE